MSDMKTDNLNLMPTEFDNLFSYYLDMKFFNEINVTFE